ncbi:MAG: flagellar hook-length control protein FliK [Myxococcota bacterium]
MKVALPTREAPPAAKDSLANDEAASPFGEALQRRQAADTHPEDLGDAIDVDVAAFVVEEADAQADVRPAHLDLSLSLEVDSQGEGGDANLEFPTDVEVDVAVVTKASQLERARLSWNAWIGDRSIFARATAPKGTATGFRPVVPKGATLGAQASSAAAPLSGVTGAVQASAGMASAEMASSPAKPMALAAPPVAEELPLSPPIPEVSLSEQSSAAPAEPSPEPKVPMGAPMTVTLQLATVVHDVLARANSALADVPSMRPPANPVAPAVVNTSAAEQGAVVQIEHPELGRIRLQLEMQDRHLRVRAIAQSSRAAAALRESEQALREDVARHGVDLTNLYVEREA